MSVSDPPRLPVRFLWLLLLLLSATAEAAPLRVPLTIPYALLESAFGAWSGGADDAGCRRLQTGAPQLEARGGELHFVATVEAALGAEVLGKCVQPLAWLGMADVVLEPYVDEDWQLRFRLGATELSDADGTRAPVLSAIWELVRHLLVPRLESFSFDLDAPRAEIRALVRSAAPVLETVLAGLRLGEPVAGERGVVVPLLLELPADLPAPPVPPPVATEAEDAAVLAARRQAGERIDAFLVFVVKQAGLDLEDPELRAALFSLLLQSRYRLLAILDGSAPETEGDPVRVLLREDWERLRGILLEAEQRGLGGGALLRYVSFLNAGDVLLALDAAAPELGVWISAEGLRRLALGLRPGYPGDPLEYGYDVDFELRRLFGFPDEPPLPPPLPEQEPDRSGGLMDWLVRPARAAAPAPDPVTLLGRHLERRVPGIDELPVYRAEMAGLLRLVGERELQDAALAPGAAAVYRALLPATALIESCWRQYVREGGKVTFIASPVGSVGLMQVNTRVWRGLYDVERLRWEVAYNARAGAQILLRYLRDPGLKVAQRSGDAAHLPRATYAAYNAGPGGATRFLARDGSVKAGAVDRRLWRLYQGFSAGAEPDLQRCDMGGDES